MASPDRILTTHVGSLPRPERLIELNAARAGGGSVDEAAYDEALAQAVSDVVARQRDAGVDVLNDGEYGHETGREYDYGMWRSYTFSRMDGFEMVPVDQLAPPRPPAPGALVLSHMLGRRDWTRFSEAYADPASGAAMPQFNRTAPVVTVRRPITYHGQEATARDIANMKAALAVNDLEDGFLNAVAPASCARAVNEYYETDEELVYACADAMREEYVAIIESGLGLQLDDPAIAEIWDQINPEPSVEAYKRFAMVRIDALNHAIRGLPEDRIRFHLCWGSWHGPHTTDIPMADIVEVMLAVNARYYSFEAGNVRHEHEWALWRDLDLPADKVLLPGVVSHATNVVEHPEVVADRIVRYADAVGRERVMASTDCGLGGRVHPQIAWAKLEALRDGAELASRRLWS
jgi:5-methyltetrahydropteroyltriglutamate--homocysteine methyltransferase